MPFFSPGRTEGPNVDPRSSYSQTFFPFFPFPCFKPVARLSFYCTKQLRRSVITGASGQSKRSWRHSHSRAGGGTTRVRPRDPGCRPPNPEPHKQQPKENSSGYFRPSSHSLSRSLLAPRPELFISSSTRRIPEKRDKMEAPISEAALNARRKAVVLKGFPLLALTFQTLGTSPIVSTPLPRDLVVSWSHPPFRDHLFGYWHCQHPRLFMKPQVPLMFYSSLPSMCLMVFGKAPHRRRMSLAV